MKNKFTLSAIVLCALTTSAFADDWPSFTAPNKQMLVNANYLSTSGCPAGEARLSANTSISMSQNCQGYCPPEWQWISKSDGLCHKLSETEFVGYRIAHYPTNNDWDYSVVTALYGSKASGQTFFEYNLTTPAGELWYCADREKQGWVSCANDY